MDKNKKTLSITNEELRSLVKEAIDKKLSSLREARDFSARREVVVAAERAAMDFENVIIKTLNMQHPDELPTNLQKQYYAVVENMKDDVVRAVMNAARELTKFPKQNSEKGKQ